MTEIEKLMKAKIPGPETGIEIKYSFCDICSPTNPCGMKCYVKDGKVIKVEGVEGHPCSRGLLCTKGSATRQYVYNPNRVLYPLKRAGERGEGKWERISWDQAFTEIADKLNETKAKYGPESVYFFVGFPKWFRAWFQRLCYKFGSPNYGTESCCCFATSKIAHLLTTGSVGKCIMDFSKANLFIGWGFNSFYSRYLQPDGMRNAIEKRGMKVIIIDPVKTYTAETYADLYIQIKPGTDAAVALGIAHELIKNDWIDHEFINEKVHGFEEYAEYVKQFTPEYAASLCGCKPEEIVKAAEMIHENLPFCFFENSAPVPHHTNGLQTYRAIIALSLLEGCYGVEGGQVFSGMTFGVGMPGYATNQAAFAKEFAPKFPDANAVGWDEFPIWGETTLEAQHTSFAKAVLTGKPYPIHALYAHGYNYRMTQDTNAQLEAIKKVDFFVDVDLFMTESAKYADYVLPCCSVLERREFQPYKGKKAYYAMPVIEPLGESKTDVEIIAGITKALGIEDPYLTADYDVALAKQLENTEIDLEELKKHQDGIPVPVVAPPLEHPIKTKSGKYEIYSEVIAKYADKYGYDPLPTWKDPLDNSDPEKYPFTMCSGARIPNEYHTRLHDLPWTRSMRENPAVEMNPEDCKALNLERGDMVEISSETSTIRVEVKPNERIQKGVVSLFHMQPEADANSLIHMEHRDPYVGFIGFRSFRVGIKKVEG